MCYIDARSGDKDSESRTLILLLLIKLVVMFAV